MARLKALENAGGHSAAITADGVVVGGITLTGKGIYSVDTKGSIPAIDGISGGSPRDAWDNVVQRIQAGGVVYHDAVHIGPYEDAQGDSIGP